MILVKGFDSPRSPHLPRALTVRGATLIRSYRQDAGREFSGSIPLAGIVPG